jgi:hypothetical protein
MNYEKPNIVATASAVEVIKGSGKGDDVNVDSQTFITESAYEADE